MTSRRAQEARLETRRPMSASEGATHRAGERLKCPPLCLLRTLCFHTLAGVALLRLPALLCCACWTVGMAVYDLAAPLHGRRCAFTSLLYIILHFHIITSSSQTSISSSRFTSKLRLTMRFAATLAWLAVVAIAPISALPITGYVLDWSCFPSILLQWQRLSQP